MPEPTSIETVPEVLPSLPPDFNPEEQIEQAKRSARALLTVIEAKPKKVVINGETYLEYEDWQTIGSFYGITVGTEWTKPIEVEGKRIGWEARSEVLRNGIRIGGAEAQCTTAEARWRGREDFQLRSMAQTRACAKGLRNVLGRVAVLAGIKPTPAEEMTVEPFPSNPPSDTPYPTLEPAPAVDGIKMISPRQKTLIEKLASEKLEVTVDGSMNEMIEGVLSEKISIAQLTSKQASRVIEHLLGLPSHA